MVRTEVNNAIATIKNFFIYKNVFWLMLRIYNNFD